MRVVSEAVRNFTGRKKGGRKKGEVGRQENRRGRQLLEWATGGRRRLHGGCLTEVAYRGRGGGMGQAEGGASVEL